MNVEHELNARMQSAQDSDILFCNVWGTVHTPHFQKFGGTDLRALRSYADQSLGHTLFVHGPVPCTQL